MYPQPRAIEPVELVDKHGQAISTAEAFEGKWWLLYFGFTYCPDACPIALSHMKQIHQELAQPDQVGFGLISVDPARDTPPRMKEYIEFFHPDFFAATGGREAIDALTEQLNVVYLIEGEPDDPDYRVDHSSFFVLLDDRGRHAGIVSAPHDPLKIAAKLNNILKGLN